VVAANLYVSTSGSDSNLGTQASPFRSWKRAAQLAKAGTVVNFLAGIYDINGGDDFADAIPDGVKLQSSGSGTATLSADGVHSLVFAGGGTVANLTLNHFRASLSASSGVQTIQGVTVTQPVGAIYVTGGAAMNVSASSNVSGAPTENTAGSAAPPLFAVDSSAQLTIRDSTVNAAWAGCIPSGYGVYATGSAIVSLSSMTCTGTSWPCMYATGSSRISLTNSTLSTSCDSAMTSWQSANVSSNGTTFSAMAANDTSSWSVTGGAFTGPAAAAMINVGPTSTISIHGARFGTTVNLWGSGTTAQSYDFGMFGTTGGNNFQGGMSVNSDDLVIQAYGNTWIPNEQGASPTGVMPSQTFTGPVDGKNVTIAAPSSGPASDVNM
jgi:hypothetical protein